MATTTISEVRICNMALTHLGESNAIESLTEGSAESNACDLWYDFSRRAALASSDWNFARGRITLADHSDDPPAAWGYRYQYPSDCIKFRRITNPAGEKKPPIPYRIELSDDRETRSILTNLDEAEGVYTFNLTQVNLFDEYFVLMLSFALASNLTYSITGKLELRQEMNRAFVEMSRAATAVNSNEDTEDLPPEADWIDGRV
jgi:hypothetical protein